MSVVLQAIERTPASKADLYVALWHAYAEALFGKGDAASLSQAKGICRSHLQEIPGSDGDDRTARLLWLLGRILGSEGDTDGALAAFGDALDHVETLMNAAGVVAITADIERLLPNSRRFKKRLESLKRFDLDTRKEVLPGWLSHLGEIIDRAMSMATVDTLAAIEYFREAGRGSAFMPS